MSIALIGQLLRQLHQGRCPGSVVVGAIVNLVFLALARERIGIAAAEVIIVRADHKHGCVRCVVRARKIRDHVPSHALLAFHFRGDARRDTGEVERAFGVRILDVELPLHFFERFPIRFEKRVGDVARHRDDRNAGARERLIEAERHQSSRAGRRRAGDDDERLRAVFARDGRLVAQAAVHVEVHAAVHAHAFGHVREDEYDLVLHVEVAIGVIRIRAGSGCLEAIADKRHRTLGARVLAERERTEVLVGLELFLAVGGADRHRVLLCDELHTRGEREGLEVSALFSQLTKARLLETLGDVRPRSLFALGAGEAALELIRGEI